MVLKGILRACANKEGKNIKKRNEKWGSNNENDARMNERARAENRIGEAAIKLLWKFGTVHANILGYWSSHSAFHRKFY